jgi:CHAD domain-containing protein
MGEMQIATETERKYDVPADFTLPELAGLGAAETLELDATYFDTDDLRLALHKFTLRRRTGGTDAGWHLKTPGDGTSRIEHRLPLTEGDGSPADVPAELLAEVRSIVRDRPLRPVLRLLTTRVETPIRDDAGRTLALLAQDAVTAETDDGQQHWQEIEVELVDGTASILKKVEKSLLKAGATAAEGPSKLARALGGRLAAAKAAEPAQGESPVLAYARQQRADLQAYDPGVRHGDPEAVHKMRVATRRLRSTLKTFKRSFDPKLASGLAEELKWLAHLLGEVRDGQVLVEKLSADGFEQVEARIRSHLGGKVEQGRAALTTELDGPRYLALLESVDALIDSATGEDDPVKRVRKALEKADGLLDEATADGEDRELHEARKSYKRARYAVEVFDQPGKKLIKRLTELQDVLGAHQDSVVAREILSELADAARSEGEDNFPYGVLHERQAQVGRDTLTELPAAVRDSRKPKLRSWLA